MSTSLKKSFTHFFFFIALLFISACVTQPKAPEAMPAQEQDILKTVEIVNARILATAKTASPNLKKFKKDNYDALLAKDASPEAAKLREYLRDFEAQDFTASEQAFALCAFSAKYEIAFCDDPGCPEIEYFEKTKTSQPLMLWKATLPKKACAPGK